MTSLVARAPTGLHRVRGLSISGLVRTRWVRKRKGALLTFAHRGEPKSMAWQVGRPREPYTPTQLAPLHMYGPVGHTSQPKHSAVPFRCVHLTAGSSHVVHGPFLGGHYRALDQGERRAGIRVKRRNYTNRGYGRSHLSYITYTRTVEPMRRPSESTGSDGAHAAQITVPPNTA